MPTALSERSESKGFTLIELLVTISIIAVLSAIGIVVFGSVQKTARDSKRMGDINSIFQAMEMHYGQCGSGAYCDLKSTYFIGGDVPKDPLNNQVKCGKDNQWPCAYCFTDFNSQPNGQPGDIWAHNGCPWHFESEGGLWWGPADLNTPKYIVGGTDKYYTEFILCANLENQVNGKWYYCKSSK